jgi:hypothetical protein
MRVLNISLYLMVLGSCTGFTAASDSEVKKEDRKIVGRLSDGRVLVQRPEGVEVEEEHTPWFRQPDFLMIQKKIFEKGPYGELGAEPGVKKP